MFDFGALPPEVNSGLMYTGAGAAPMMAAASAWNSLAAELGTAAAAYQSVISELSGQWLGPSSAAMAAAAEPYIAWMSYTAEAAQHAAAQATASAAAYETAFAMTVPPPVIAANRAQLAALVATNFLGQNTPAIMATEAHYAEMWAQDAAAMYGYAASSAAAATLHPLTSPLPTTNPAGPALQAGALTHAAASNTAAQAELPQLVSTLPSAVGGLANPLSAATGSSDPGILSSINNVLSNTFVTNTINSVDVTAAWNVMMLLTSMPLLGHFLANAPAGVTLGDVTPLGAGLGRGTVLASAVGPGTGEAPVLAGVGQASSVGALSVPTGWSAATPASSAAPLAGVGWAAAPEGEPAATLPAGIPAVASATRGAAGFGAPRYGVKPTVMPRPVGVG